MVPSDSAERVWALKCLQCLRVTDFADACVPTRRLVEWGTCCGQIMELESVERSRIDE